MGVGIALQSGVTGLQKGPADDTAKQEVFHGMA